MAKIKMPHSGHTKHLCYLQNLGFAVQYPREYKSLVRNGKYVCERCGRVAAKRENLCKPAAL